MLLFGDAIGPAYAIFWCFCIQLCPFLGGQTSKMFSTGNYATIYGRFRRSQQCCVQRMCVQQYVCVYAKHTLCVLCIQQYDGSSIGFNKQRFVLLWLNKPHFYCFSFELPFSLMFSSDTRKERETQLAEHVSHRRPLRLFYRVSARLSLFPKTSNRGFSFHRCGELFLLYVTSQTTKSQNGTLPFTLPISRSS